MFRYKIGDNIVNSKENHLLRKEEKTRKKALLSQRTRIYNEMVAYQKKHSKEKKYPPTDCFISLQHINKIYDNKVQAVFDFNIDIKKHEFIVFVGPSGCGKSTTLRMIAGLEDISGGELYIDNVYANNLDASKRNIAMVFQNYALYPHMNSYQNRSYGLKRRKISKPVLDKNNEVVYDLDRNRIKELKKEIKKAQTPEEVEMLNKQLKEAETTTVPKMKMVHYQMLGLL